MINFFVIQHYLNLILITDLWEFSQLVSLAE
jgi:hypothetical protein